MKNYLQKNRTLILGIIIGTFAIYVVSSLTIENRLTNLRSSIEANLQVSLKTLTNLSGEIARGEANATASMVALECSALEQAQFDSRLGRLDNGLSQIELKELDTLFNRCAPVSVIKRSAMVVQLEAEYKMLELLAEQRKILGEYEEYDEKLTVWKELVEKEKLIAGLSFDSINLQYEIIRQLMMGLKVDSNEAEELKNKGQSIRVELSRFVGETVALRERLK